MSHIEINWNPSSRQLKQFGSIALVGFPLAGWVLSGWPGWGAAWTDTDTKVIGGAALFGVVAALVGLSRPQLLKPVFLLLTLITFPIGLVVSEVLVLLIYVTLFVPMGLLFRIIGRDALERSIDRDRKSYWKSKAQPPNPRSYFRQS